MALASDSWQGARICAYAAAGRRSSRIPTISNASARTPQTPPISSGAAPSVSC